MALSEEVVWSYDSADAARVKTFLTEWMLPELAPRLATRDNYLRNMQKIAEMPPEHQARSLFSVVGSGTTESVLLACAEILDFQHIEHVVNNTDLPGDLWKNLRRLQERFDDDARVLPSPWSGHIANAKEYAEAKAHRTVCEWFNTAIYLMRHGALSNYNLDGTKKAAVVAAEAKVAAGRGKRAR